MLIELQDSMGDRLERVLVPVFDPMPQVLIWRKIVFIQISALVYRQCFVYFVLEPEVLPPPPH